MSRRSKVELYEQIRKAHEREALSIHALSRRFGVHRRDVRQALSSAVPPPRKAVVRPAPVLGPWKATIDGWLEADKTMPRKLHHTARRVWQRLVEEHSVEVGESTVRRCVAEARRRQAVPLVEVMVPQRHPLGEEAEVDFGSIHVYLAGGLTELPLFLMRLSASGKGFARAYLTWSKSDVLPTPGSPTRMSEPPRPERACSTSSSSAAHSAARPSSIARMLRLGMHYATGLWAG